MAETSTIFGFMKYVSATDILSDFKKTVDSYFVNSLRPTMEVVGLGETVVTYVHRFLPQKQFRALFIKSSLIEPFHIQN